MQKLISTRTTRERFGGISTMTEWRRRKAGLLPPVVTISGRNFDVEQDIGEIIAAYAAAAGDDAVKGIVKRQITDRAESSSVAA